MGGPFLLLWQIMGGRGERQGRPRASQGPRSGGCVAEVKVRAKNSEEPGAHFSPVPVETAGSKAMSGFFQHGSSGGMVTLMEKPLALWDLSVYMPGKAELQRPRGLTGGQRGH